MKLHLLLYCLCSLYLWPVNSQERIPGPDFLVTDLTSNLTLTCPVNTSSGQQYGWFTPGNDTARCATQEIGKVCIFIPRLEDDNQNVTCQVTGPGVLGSLAFYQVNLKYPPQSSPNITVEPPQTVLLKQGDVITCTVSGGKPRVTNVTFDCQDPDHADRDDDVSDDGLTVSSSITVNSSRATEVNMTCTCNAFWAPEPGLYSYITNTSFQLEYKATVTNFTVNDTAKLTVNETSNSTVTFTCQGDGRPPPDLKLYKKGNDTALMETRSQPLVYTMNNVVGEDLATYTCEADNGFPVPNKRSVKLFVNSAPRIVESFNSSNPPTLLTEGLTFTLVAYPKPEYKESHFLGNMNLTTPVPAPKNTFTVQCARNMTMEHLVNCHVSTQKVSKERAGLYELTVSNGLGDASFRFRVESPDKATVTDFTVNDTAKLTVNETSNSTVTFTCQGDGRPPPDLKLYKKGNDTALMETRSQPLVYTMNNVVGEDLATYTCEADNGFPVPNNRSVKLFVNSAPRIVESFNSSNPKALSTEGLMFTLVAYPNPEYKESHFLGNMNLTTPVPAPENTFTVQCARNMTMEHLVNCHVTLQNVPKERAGLYELTVSNGLGDASFRFRVESPGTTPQDDDSILTVAIVGAVAGFLLFIGIIVICVICHRRRKRNAARKRHSGSQNRHRNNGTASHVTNNKRTSAALQDSRPDSTGTTTYDKTNDGPSSAGGNTTAPRYSTDSKGYASVGDTRRQGSNKAASTRRNNVPTTGYEDVELDQQGAPTVMTTPEKPDVVASIPEDSAEGIIGPKGDVYAVVAPKQKGNN